MTFSTIFLVHTTLLLGQGQLHQQYGVNQRDCQNELYRTARIIEQSDNYGAAVDAVQAKEFSKRIVKDCYANRISQDAGLVGSDSGSTED